MIRIHTYSEDLIPFVKVDMGFSGEGLRMNVEHYVALKPADSWREWGRAPTDFIKSTRGNHRANNPCEHFEVDIDLGPAAVSVSNADLRPYVGGNGGLQYSRYTCRSFGSLGPGHCTGLNSSKPRWLAAGQTCESSWFSEDMGVVYTSFLREDGYVGYAWASYSKRWKQFNLYAGVYFGYGAGYPTSTGEYLPSVTSTDFNEKQLRVHLARAVAYAEVMPPKNQIAITKPSLTSRITTKELSDQAVYDIVNEVSAYAAEWKSAAVSQIPYPQSMTAMALQGLNKYTGNMLAYVADLPSLAGTIFSLATTLTNILSGQRVGKTLKDLAGSWLSVRFGDRLTICDTVELARTIGDTIVDRACVKTGWAAYNKVRSAQTKVAQVTVQSVEQPTTAKFFEKMFFEPKNDSGLSPLIRELRRWDAYPTLENLWDMVPLSFVVDWVVNVGDILSSIDNTALAAHYTLKQRMWSGKYTADLTLPEYVSDRIAAMWGIQVLNVSCRYYYRRIGYKIPLGSSLEPSFWNLGIANIIDGISLIITR